MREPPRKIWLQYYGDEADPVNDASDGDVTWCQDQINKHDVEYVRTTWLERLEKIEAAAENLIMAKGRHHTEQAMTALLAAVKAPHF